ncbi:carbohydrate-binding module family 20 protein [Botryobasidium botryosum FD-172 SS1]|uniref:Glucoamylase n=1 Tax=Botryobasidium botryosum (strain FD-172 SS1) TaxID=930990 RepID=A0A067MM92_BOTB1|nr:carbohydrate-binding module family 20 protein [Botryobasidium botryosum FD-172 SS1]
MRFAVCSLLSLSSTALALVHGDVKLSRRQSGVDAFVTSEDPIAIQGVLNNIGPGSMSKGAKPGVVVASPDHGSPDPVDYLYTWTRDSSLVLKLLIDRQTQGRGDFSTTIDNWRASTGRIQQLDNPSGGPTTGGLGEPKFNIDETPFTGAWGRPQRDGPALRATAAITYANSLGATGNASALYPSIKLDLDYVSQYWNGQTFDLWEEVNSAGSAFTTAVQHRALREGAKFAAAQGDTASATTYATQADGVLCYLQTYWDASKGYIVANKNNGRTGKDANTILASIHTFDPAAGCDAATWQPCSDIALANHKVVVDSFRTIYALNSAAPAGAAVAVGRYLEDGYFGGNPWFINTFAAAELLYDALFQWEKIGSITVTNTSLAFFQQFSSTITPAAYPSSSSEFTSLTAAIKTYADGFLAIAQKYIPASGEISEQFSRKDGTQMSATYLTWSFAAAATAFDARAGHVSASWGASGLTVPTDCPPAPINPGGGGGGGGNGGGSTIEVTFHETATTTTGEALFITGSLDALGDWSTENAVPLKAGANNVWTVVVPIPGNYIFECKKKNGTLEKEETNQHQATTPYTGTYTLNDTWQN